MCSFCVQHVFSLSSHTRRSFPPVSGLKVNAVKEQYDLRRRRSDGQAVDQWTHEGKQTSTSNQINSTKHKNKRINNKKRSRGRGMFKNRAEGNELVHSSKVKNPSLRFCWHFNFIRTGENVPFFCFVLGKDQRWTRPNARTHQFLFTWNTLVYCRLLITRDVVNWS